MYSIKIIKIRFSYKRVIIKAVSCVLLIAFSATTFLADTGLAEALNVWTFTEQPTYCQALAKMYLDNRLILVANTPRKLGLLARYYSEALLLTNGKYLITEEIKNDPFKFIRAVVHEDFEILWQLEERKFQARYEALRDMVLKDRNILNAYRKLPNKPQRDEHGPSILFNDIMSSAFELDFIIREKLITKEKLTAAEQAFLDATANVLKKLSAKDETGAYINLSELFFNKEARLSYILNVQQAKKTRSEKFARVAKEAAKAEERSEDQASRKERIKAATNRKIMERYLQFKKLVADYMQAHGGQRPTQEEMAGILGISQSAISIINSKILKSGLSGIDAENIRMRRPNLKRKIYVSDEDFIRVRSDFIKKTGRVPNGWELASLMNITENTVSTRLKKLGLLPSHVAHPRRHISEKDIIAVVERYKKEHSGVMPQLRDIEEIFGLTEAPLVDRIFRININNLSRAAPFLITKGSRRFAPEEIAEAERIDPQAACFESLQDAVKDVIGRINSILKDDEEVKRLAGFHAKKSPSIVRRFLMASRGALTAFMDKGAFYSFSHSIADRKTYTFGYCSGDKFYIYKPLIDPHSPQHEDTKFLALIIFDTLLKSFFSSDKFINEMKNSVLSERRGAIKRKPATASEYLGLNGIGDLVKFSNMAWGWLKGKLRKRETAQVGAELSAEERLAAAGREERTRELMRSLRPDFSGKTELSADEFERHVEGMAHGQDVAYFKFDNGPLSMVADEFNFFKRGLFSADIGRTIIGLVTFICMVGVPSEFSTIRQKDKALSGVGTSNTGKMAFVAPMIAASAAILAGIVFHGIPALVFISSLFRDIWLSSMVINIATAYLPSLNNIIRKHELKHAYASLLVNKLVREGEINVPVNKALKMLGPGVFSDMGLPLFSFGNRTDLDDIERMEDHIIKSVVSKTSSVPTVAPPAIIESAPTVTEPVHAPESLPAATPAVATPSAPDAKPQPAPSVSEIKKLTTSASVLIERQMPDEAKVKLDEALKKAIAESDISDILLGYTRIITIYIKHEGLSPARVNDARQIVDLVYETFKKHASSRLMADRVAAPLISRFNRLTSAYMEEGETKEAALMALRGRELFSSNRKARDVWKQFTYILSASLMPLSAYTREKTEIAVKEFSDKLRGHPHDNLSILLLALSYMHPSVKDFSHTRDLMKKIQRGGYVGEDVRKLAGSIVLLSDALAAINTALFLRDLEPLAADAKKLCADACLAGYAEYIVGEIARVKEEELKARKYESRRRAEESKSRGERTGPVPAPAMPKGEPQPIQTGKKGKSDVNKKNYTIDDRIKEMGEAIMAGDYNKVAWLLGILEPKLKKQPNNTKLAGVIERGKKFLTRSQRERYDTGGSIAGVVKYLLFKAGALDEKSARSGKDIAKGMGLSYATIDTDLRALYYHLHFIEKVDRQETGKDARYYVPESVRKRMFSILPVLYKEFRGKTLRPNRVLLKKIYEEKIKPILEAPEIIRLYKELRQRAVREYWRLRRKKEYKEADLLSRILLANQALAKVKPEGNVRILPADLLKFHLATSLKENPLLDEFRKRLSVLIDAMYKGEVKDRQTMAEIMQLSGPGRDISGPSLTAFLLGMSRIEGERLKPEGWITPPGVLFANRPEELLWRDLYRAMWQSTMPGFLDAENSYDRSLLQRKVFFTGGSLEFSPGYLYHGRDGLDKVLMDGELKGSIPLCRVGHQYATYGLGRETSKSPAIFVIRSEFFNKLRRQRKAELHLVGDLSSSAGDPYPTIKVPVELDDIAEIWITEAAFARYQKILSSETLDEKERIMKPALEKLMAEGKIKAIPGPKPENPEDADDPFSDNPRDALKIVGSYMESRGLLTNMPLMRAAPQVVTLRESLTVRTRARIRKIVNSLKRSDRDLSSPVQVDAIYIDMDKEMKWWMKDDALPRQLAQDIAYLLRTGTAVNIITRENFATFSLSGNNIVHAIRDELKRSRRLSKMQNLRITYGSGAMTAVFNEEGKRRLLKGNRSFPDSVKLKICRGLAHLLLDNIDKDKYSHIDTKSVRAKLKIAKSVEGIVDAVNSFLKDNASRNGEKTGLIVDDNRIALKLGSMCFYDNDDTAKKLLEKVKGASHNIFLSTDYDYIEFNLYDKAGALSKRISKDARGGILVGVSDQSSGEGFIKRLLATSKAAVLPIYVSDKHNISKEGSFIHAKGFFDSELLLTIRALRQAVEQGLTYYDLPFIANRYSPREVAGSYGISSINEFQDDVLDEDSSRKAFGLILEPSESIDESLEFYGWAFQYGLGIRTLKVSGKRVLDAGTGLGALSMWAKKRGAKEVIGIDINPESIKRAKKIAKREGLEIRYEKGDATHTRFEDSRFGLVTSGRTLEFLTKDDRRKALREMHRVLNKNGTLLIVIHDDEGRRAGKDGRIIWPDGYWDEKAWEAELNDAGFADIHIDVAWPTEQKAPARIIYATKLSATKRHYTGAGAMDADAVPYQSSGGRGLSTDDKFRGVIQHYKKDGEPQFRNTEGGLFMETPEGPSAELFKISGLGQGMTFMDLGSGDGLMLALAQAHGADAIGYEINEGLCEETAAHIKELSKNGLVEENRIIVKRGDYRYSPDTQSDISKADIIYMGLTMQLTNQSITDQLKPLEGHLLKNMKPGAKLYVYASFPGVDIFPRLKEEKSPSKKFRIFIKSTAYAIVGKDGDSLQAKPGDTLPMTFAPGTRSTFAELDRLVAGEASLNNALTDCGKAIRSTKDVSMLRLSMPIEVLKRSVDMTSILKKIEFLNVPFRLEVTGVKDTDIALVENLKDKLGIAGKVEIVAVREADIVKMKERIVYDRRTEPSEDQLRIEAIKRLSKESQSLDEKEYMAIVTDTVPGDKVAGLEESLKDQLEDNISIRIMTNNDPSHCLYMLGNIITSWLKDIQSKHSTIDKLPAIVPPEELMRKLQSLVENAWVALAAA